MFSYIHLHLETQVFKRLMSFYIGNARVQKMGWQVMACQSTKLSRHRCHVGTF